MGIQMVGGDLVASWGGHLLFLAIRKIARPAGAIRPQPVRHYRHSPRYDRPRPDVQVRIHGRNGNPVLVNERPVGPQLLATDAVEVEILGSILPALVYTSGV